MQSPSITKSFSLGNWTAYLLNSPITFGSTSGFFTRCTKGYFPHPVPYPHFAPIYRTFLPSIIDLAYRKLLRDIIDNNKFVSLFPLFSAHCIICSCLSFPVVLSKTIFSSKVLCKTMVSKKRPDGFFIFAAHDDKLKTLHPLVAALPLEFQYRLDLTHTKSSYFYLWNSFLTE